MNPKKIGFITLTASLIIVGSIVFFALQGKKSSSSSNNMSSSTTSGQPAQTNGSGNSQNNNSKAISKTEVAKHNSETDCWTIINGNVYDITEYIPQHPGGAEILRACGVDASTLFNQRMTSDGQSIGSGTSHSSAAQSILEQFKIGIVAN